MHRLEGKTALITGAARGIGAQIARRFAEEGARVIVNDLELEVARKTAAELGGHAIAADVSDSAAVGAMFLEVRKLAPRLDILVNNAGISGLEGRNDANEIIALRLKQAEQVARGGPVETFLDVTVSTSDAGWRRMLGVHLDGTFYCCREALKIMNPQMSGAIINMGSIMGTYGKPADMTAPLGEFRKRIAAQTPLARFGDTDDIAWAAVYLASDEAKFMTGQVISPNGGWYMSQ